MTDKPPIRYETEIKRVHRFGSTKYRWTLDLRGGPNNAYFVANGTASDSDSASVLILKLINERLPHGYEPIEVLG